MSIEEGPLSAMAAFLPWRDEAKFEKLKILYTHDGWGVPINDPNLNYDQNRPQPREFDDLLYIRNLIETRQLTLKFRDEDLATYQNDINSGKYEGYEAGLFNDGSRMHVRPSEIPLILPKDTEHLIFWIANDVEKEEAEKFFRDWLEQNGLTRESDIIIFQNYYIEDPRQRITYLCGSVKTRHFHILARKK